jgi:hypothetical protein
MKFKRICAAAVMVAMLMSLGVSAASAGSSSAPSSGASSSAGQSDPHNGHGYHHGGDFGALKSLSDLTGIKVPDLLDKYPQKTAWQIAKQLGKLDDLKKVFLAEQKTFLDKLVADGKVTADEGSKIYADLQKRVAAVDGTGTVTLGKPGYRPQHKA